jgi:hypothetical protein
MIWWIESQETAVIVVLTFALCYAIAGALLAVIAVVARFPVAADLKFLVPVLLTPLSVVTGLLVAFLASRVWTNLDHANHFVAEEASAIRETALLSLTLPEPARDSVRSSLQQHLRFVQAEDWPAMLEGRATIRQPPSHLTEAMTALLAFDATGSGQRVAQERAVVAIERALEARRGRILLSNGVIAPAQWLVIFVLDGLILVTIGLIHLERRMTAAAGMFLYSTAVACCLMLLMIHDRPFSPGGYVVQPSALRQVGIE